MHGARRLFVIGLALMATGCAVGCFPERAAAATPVVMVTPSGGSSTSNSFQDGEVVTVAVSKNSVFTPGVKVNILECADPQGTVANLPKDISSCDGETIQGDTVLVQRNGAVSESHYTLYRLPSTTLGEAPDGVPVCNTSNECVLYVGQDQNDFTQPKLFSPPFTITPTSSASSAPTGATTSAGASSASATTAPSSATSDDPQASLAFTGPGEALPWLVGGGGVLLVVGGLGRRWMKVRS